MALCHVLKELWSSRCAAASSCSGTPPPELDLDVTFGGLPFEEAAVAKSQEHNIGGLRVRFPRVEDLLVMKAIARRPKDIEDIRGLLAANPHADIKEARHWVREFAAAMSMSRHARGV